MQPTADTSYDCATRALERLDEGIVQGLPRRVDKNVCSSAIRCHAILSYLRIGGVEKSSVRKLEEVTEQSIVEKFVHCQGDLPIDEYSDAFWQDRNRECFAGI